MGNTKKKVSKTQTKPKVSATKIKVVNEKIDTDDKDNLIKKEILTDAEKKQKAYKKRVEKASKGIKKKNIKKNKETKKTLDISTTVKKDNIISKVVEKKDDFKEQDATKEITTKKINVKLIAFIIGTIAIILLSITFVINYKKPEILLNYATYKIGEKVKIFDDSIWYVVEDSGNNKSTVLLLSTNPVDINLDGKIDGNDKVAFSKSNGTEYDEDKKDNIAYKINEYYKNKYKNKSDIKSASLLTSKQFVKIRNKMNFGYEWEKGNWLANSKIGTWWINAVQNNKIYVVSTKGSYMLVAPNKKHYIRLALVVDKNDATKVTE